MSNIEVKFAGTTESGRAVYTVGQPSVEMCAAVFKRLIDKRLLEEAKAEAERSTDSE